MKQCQRWSRRCWTLELILPPSLARSALSCIILFRFSFFFGCSSFLLFFFVFFVSFHHAPCSFPFAMITFQSQSPDAPHLVARLLKNASTRLFEIKSSNQTRNRKSRFPLNQEKTLSYNSGKGIVIIIYHRILS